VCHLRYQIIKECAHQPALLSVCPDNVPDMFVAIMSGQVRVQDLLAEEIRMEVCGLFYGVKLRKNPWGA